MRLRVAKNVKKVENDEKIGDKNQGSSGLPFKLLYQTYPLKTVLVGQ